MGDLLLVHELGHGAWSWGSVWGHVTSPSKHPPRLHGKGPWGKVVAVDLPGHGASVRTDAVPVGLEGLASALLGEVEEKGLRDLTVAAHGLSSLAVLRAAARMDPPPRRVVLFGGLVPEPGKCAIDMLPRTFKMAFRLMARRGGRRRSAVRLPKTAINWVLCNGMDPFEVIKIAGRFGPLPMAALREKAVAEDIPRGCPVVYVPLRRDRLLPSELQRRMIQRLDSAEVAPELDSCHEVTIERPREVADLLLKYA